MSSLWPGKIPRSSLLQIPTITSHSFSPSITLQLLLLASIPSPQSQRSVASAILFISRAALTMDSYEAKFQHNPPLKRQRVFHLAQVLLRVLAIATTLAATSVTITTRQTVVIFGTPFDARYTYSSAFRFFAFANAVACAFSILSLFYVAIVVRQRSTVNPANYFILFLHDLVMMCLVLAGCAAATAVGYIGKYGNSHIGWMGICDHFGKFCNRVTFSVILSYLSFLFLMVLAIITASRSRQIQV